MDFAYIQKLWTGVKRLQQELFPPRIPGFSTIDHVELTQTPAPNGAVGVTFSNIQSIAKDQEQAVAVFSEVMRTLFMHCKGGGMVQIGRTVPGKISFIISGGSPIEQAARPVRDDNPQEAMAEARKTALGKCVDLSDVQIVKRTKIKTEDILPPPHAASLTKIVGRRKLK